MKSVAIPLFLCLTLLLSCAASAETVTYTVLVSDLPAEIVRGISEGESVTDGAGKEKAGTVLSLRAEPLCFDRYDEIAGVFTAEESPDLCCLLLTVRAEAERRNGILTAGTLRLRIGETVALHLPHLSAEGRITQVEVMP